VYKKAKFLFFCMIFVVGNTYCQKLQSLKTTFSLLKTTVKPMPTGVLLNQDYRQITSPPVFLSPGYYASQLGFFCKQEIKFEKTAKIPFKFRLGSVEDCDRMEGKKRVN
jgi:hypothetical protein